MYAAFGKIEADVIIVGAGISGLTAAHTILRLDPGLVVIILEANYRIGGRLLSTPLKTRNGKKNFDIGGQFVRREQKHLKMLLDSLGLQLQNRCSPDGGKILVELQPNRIVTCNDNVAHYGNILESIELIKFFGKFEKLIENVTIANPISIINYEKLDNTSMEDYLISNLEKKSNKNFLRNLIRTSLGVEAGDISVLFYIVYCRSTGGIVKQFINKENGEGHFTIEGGAQKICDILAEDIEDIYILTGDPVKSITRNDSEVIVKTETKGFRAKNVIVAIPPPKILEINFTPALTHTRIKILQNMIPSHVGKFVVTYQTAFWKEKGLSGDIFCYKDNKKFKMIYCYNISTPDCPALTGQFICSKLLNVSNKDEILKQLAFYLGNEALNPLDYEVKCWQNDSFVGNCSMCYPPIGFMKEFAEIRRPIGRIFWAGTETSTYWNGHIGGAVQAGYRAAIEVLYDLRPQSLKVSDLKNLQPKEEVETRYKDSIVNEWSNWKKWLKYIILVYIVYRNRKRIFRLFKFFKADEDNY